MNQFTHLHCHSDMSILDGAARIPDMVRQATELGQPAIALTDHGSMAGAYAFFHACKAAEITPIIGIEAYLAPKSRLHKEPVYWGQPEQKSDDVSGGGRYTHLTMLAYNDAGLHNLIRLSSRAWTEGRVGKWPRIDRELMSQYSEGIIVTTGCPGGAVQTRLRLDQYRNARNEAEMLRDIYGPENVFVEVMNHGLEMERTTRDGLVDIADWLGLKPVVTNDSHFVMAKDAATHDALLAINTGSRLADENRFKFNGEGYYLRSTEEMYGLDQSDFWQAGCHNTLLIAERVDITGMFEHRDLMPQVKLPVGVTAEQQLRTLCEAAFTAKTPGTGVYRSRLDYELQVIGMTGYAHYFLFTADFVNWARRNGIQVGCRGSGAGSLAGYLLGITDADPVKYDLVFERLLNPERKSMPDYDIDIQDDRRGEVINYLKETYGDDCVANINTFGIIKARAAIKDSARVMGKSFGLSNQMSRLVPPLMMGRDVSLAEMYDSEHPRYKEAAEFRKFTDTDPDAREILALARELEGIVRSTGVHAAGLVVSPEPLAEHVPLQQGADGVTKIQFDYPTAESLGLVKVDLLGLKTLTVVAKALKYIADTGNPIDLQSLPEDDTATFSLLRAGDTLGCFQLDSGPMRALLRQLEPESIHDLAAVVALYRPGPMSTNTHFEYAERKNGRKPVRPIHPELSDALGTALGSTYGLLVYQESILKAAQEVAGYSLGRADVLRKAVGKKRTDVMAAERETFASGMQERGYSEAAITGLWDTIVGFADYGFNKSHATMYGILAYRTAYLKANYPAEFMAALLTSEAADPEKRAVYLAECRRMKVPVLVPDINQSGSEFTPSQGSIRFGLASIRNVGPAVVEEILKERETSGPFLNFQDYIARVDKGRNKRVVESLIESGAFDAFGHTRLDMSEQREKLVKGVTKLAKQRDSGQGSLFDDFDPVKDLGAIVLPEIQDTGQEWTEAFKLSAEREKLGLYVSAHPLDSIAGLIAEKSDAPIPQILNDADAFPNEHPVTFAGYISTVDMKVNKQGSPWCIATVEDLDASIEVLVFARDYISNAPNIILNTTVVVRGRVDRRDDQPKIIAVAVDPLEAS